MTVNYAIDTSILVRLVTGHPEKEAIATCRILQERYLNGNDFQVSAMVVGEAYMAIQHHYKLSKPQVRKALINVLESKLIQPMEGSPVLEALKASTGAGLLDRLIAIQGTRSGMKTLTLDKKMSRIQGCEFLNTSSL